MSAVRNTRLQTRSVRSLVVLLSLATPIFALVIGIGLLQNRRHLASAKSALQENRPDQAEDRASLIIGRRPSAEAYLVRCRARWQQEKFEPAVLDLLEAKRLGCPLDTCELERCLILAAAGGFSEAEPYLRSRLLGGIDDFVVHRALAHGYSQQFELDKAIYCLDDWIKKSPNDSIPYLLRAELFEHLPNHKEDCLADYRKAAELQPQNSRALKAAAKLSLDLGQLNDSKQFFDGCLALTPDDASAHVGLGVYWVKMAEHDRAIKHFDRAIEINPDQPEALVQRALLDLEKGSSQSAIARLERAARHEPYNRDVFLWLANARARTGDRERANQDSQRYKTIEELFKRCEELHAKLLENPNQIATLEEVIRVLDQLGKHHEATRWAKRLRELVPTNELALAVLSRKSAQSK